jgi:hypothetical protein
MRTKQKAPIVTTPCNLAPDAPAPIAGCRAQAGPPPAATQLRDFLAGKTDETPLLHALYDHVLDEPVPARLRAVLRFGRPQRD